MIRGWTLVPAKHEKVAIYAINPRISNVCRIAKVVKQRSNPYHWLQFSKEGYYDTNFQKKQENHKTIFVTVFFMLHCFSSYFLHRIGQAHNKEKANGSKNNCGQTNIHFLLCDFSSWWRRIDIDLSSDGTCFVSVYSQKKSIYPKYLGWKIRLDD